MIDINSNFIKKRKIVFLDSICVRIFCSIFLPVSPIKQCCNITHKTQNKREHKLREKNKIVFPQDDLHG